MKKILSLLLLLTALGCAAKQQSSVNFDTTEPLRVAVLPFATVGADGKLTNEESRLLVDNLGLTSSKLAETPAQIVRRFTFAELEHTGLDPISSALIDIDLPHRGFGLPDGTIDLNGLYAASPKELCSDFLNCDAVLYGTVTKWDRSYYGVEAVNTVGIRLTMVAARDGKVLFSSTVEDSSSRGITKGPTGFSDLVVAPIQGLDSAIITQVAEGVVKRALAPLRIDARPEYLQSAPPSIYAASQYRARGSGAKSAPLRVVLYGSPGALASFSIEPALTVPMIETTPGHYYGEYLSPPGAAAPSGPITVTLTDSFGRSTVEPIGPEPDALLAPAS